MAIALETAAKDVKKLTVATRQDMKESKPYDLRKIIEEGKKGDSMCYRCGHPDHVAEKRSVDPKMSLFIMVASWVISGMCVRVRRGIPQKERTHSDIGL